MPPLSLTRRVVPLAATAILAVAASPSVAAASDPEPVRQTALVNASGGWDVTNLQPTRATR